MELGIILSKKSLKESLNKSGKIVSNLEGKLKHKTDNFR
jgi:hypothetical protein